jgi:MFS transporter, OFA family, oxalate/formate antiporter
LLASIVGGSSGGGWFAWLHEATKSWIVVFSVMIVLDLAAAVMAVLVLRPLRANVSSRA